MKEQSLRLPMRKSGLDKKEKVTAFLFILPAFVGFTVFTLISLVISAGYAFTDFNPIKGTAAFVGANNFVSLFTNKVYAQAFVSAILNTLFLLLAVPAGIVLSVVIAAVMGGRKFHGSAFFRTVIYLPAVTSVVAVNFIWRYMFQDTYGVINAVLHVQIPWLSNNTLVKVAMIVKNVWGGLGTQVILFMAGLQNISEEYYEAADLDGATGLTKFFRITLPLLTPVLFYTVITGLIGGLQSYADVQLFAAGHYGARTVVHFIWMRGIGQNRYGLASAASLLLAMSILLITIVQFKCSKWVVYDE